jgi:hypothetical protein
MLNIHAQSIALVFNLLDATPYMYVSVSNMLFGSIWVAVIIGIFALLKKKKQSLDKEDASD